MNICALEFLIANHRPNNKSVAVSNPNQLSENKLLAFLQKSMHSKKEDFADLKENDFIILLGSANIITKDQKRILEEKLGIRNTAAHPNSIEIRESKVTNYIEDLVPNVISKFQ